MNGDFRPLTVFVDGKQIADGNRIRVQGRSNMTLLPDFFTIDLYNISDNDEYNLKNGKMIWACGEDNGMLCYGEIDDIYTHIEEGNEIISVGVSDGQTFWDTNVEKTIKAGVRLKETIVAVLKGAVIGSYLAENPRLVRGQVFHGKLPYIVKNIASGVNARAFYSHGAVHVVTKGKALDTVKISDDEIISNPRIAKGIRMYSVDVRGYPVGAMVKVESGTYRLVSQSIDADNFIGKWETVIILVDESMVENVGGW